MIKRLKIVTLAAVLAFSAALVPQLAHALNTWSVAANETSAAGDAGYGPLTQNLKKALTTPEPAKPVAAPIQPSLNALTRPKPATHSAVATARRSAKTGTNAKDAGFSDFADGFFKSDVAP